MDDRKNKLVQVKNYPRSENLPYLTRIEAFDHSNISKD